MGWIKRNLYFVIGSVAAIALLALGGLYTFGAWSHNSASSEKLGDIYQTLQKLQRQTPSPGNDKINNTTIAREQAKKVQAWISGAENYFHPVQPIPSGTVTSESLASALRRTIDLLQREADANSVALPPKYDFSFSAQRQLVKFAPGSLDPLAAQLGEVKAVSKVLFSSRINALEGIQRVRISEDDLKGAQGDYLNAQPVTNGMAVMTPYVVTFRGFSPELAAVICAFANSSNAFLVKSINVQPAGAATGTEGNPPPGMAPGRFNPGVPQQPAAGRGGLPTVLKEQLLRVTMEVEIVKLLPKTKT